MIFNKWFSYNETSDDLLELRDKFSEEFNGADYSNILCYDLIVYDGEKPSCLARMEGIDGKFVIVGVAAGKEIENITMEDLAVRLLIRRAVDSGAEKVYFIPTENSRKLAEVIGFMSSGEKIRDCESMVRYGDVGGDCC
ncbi:hypothetical protein SAMN02745751_01584 [Dethiosulfatibacter aminovorans DSM 17477]|uniref:Uncharacterized protein n=1 Tax=Dethiosulfatibacter aminovorans DSM 17477 TaxID=1121476 RepID=A0A1M6FYB3_9FIRM|nr:hypothetical protein [Dethiosulfatibacter aminovorans]SHJ02642.1 hypothetical protein SAMN02745751_01584 [Dethiosulfatibacter aminovorans DSM 17477]